MYYYFILFFIAVYLYYKTRNDSEDDDENCQKIDINGESKDFPNGWYVLLGSEEVVAKEAKHVSLCGQDVAIFRGASGQVYVLNAYCPHLGANVGIGGKVSKTNGDDCISCPFHGWSFRGNDGKCNHIPNLEAHEIPSAAKLKVWTVVEKNSMIYIWIHSEDIEPPFTPEDYSIKYGMDLKFRQKCQTFMNSAIKEWMQTYFDPVHIKHVQGSNGALAIDAQFYPVDSDYPDCQYRRYKTEYYYLVNFLGMHIAELKASCQITGPSITDMLFSIKSSWFTDQVLIVHNYNPFTQKTMFHNSRIYTKRSFKASIFARIFIIIIEKMTMKYKVILDNAIQLDEPALSEEDVLIKKYLVWFKSFYPKVKENAIKKVKDLPLDENSI